MNPHDENLMDDRLEGQINRDLDGELSEDERLALNRELIRRPELREILECSRRIDALAGAALRSVLDESEGPRLTLPGAASACASRDYSRAWWMMPVAAAAAVLFALLLYPRLSDNAQPIVDLKHERALPGVGTTDRAATQVSYPPAKIDRHLGRDVYGVLGTDGNLYMIETDHTRTLKQAGGRAQPRLLGGDL